MRSKLFRVLMVAAVLLSVVVLAQAAAAQPSELGLPASTGNGLTTSVMFQPSWGGQGRFAGIRIAWVDRYVTRVVIRQQFGAKTTYYNGPVTAGQVISFPDVRIVWTGYRSQHGSHMQGVRVVPLYR